MKYIVFFFLFSTLLFAQETNTSVSTKKPSSKWDNIEFDYEIDAYYSNVSVTIPISKETVKNYKTKTEMQVYSDLFLKSIPPKFIVIELSYNPLPNLGVYLKENQRKFYDESTILGTQLVDSITAGFEEPYALSMFLGNTVKFSDRNDTIKAGNRAYGGFLLSLTDGHIKDSTLVHDPSFEAEWKIIGHRNFDDYKLSWSYRIGIKVHSNEEIADTYYVGFRRSRLDFKDDALSIINNSAFEIKATLKWGTFEPIGYFFLFQKKFPIELFGKKMGLNFGVGYVYQGDNKYSGTLKQEGVETHKFIIRPNIQF